MNYDDIINRVKFFRSKANLSARETSMRLGYNPQFIKTIESESVELKVKTLLDFCDVVGISIYDFIYLGEKYSPERKEYLDLFLSLGEDKKDAIIKLMKSMK